MKRGPKPSNKPAKLLVSVDKIRELTPEQVERAKGGAPYPCAHSYGQTTA